MSTCDSCTSSKIVHTSEELSAAIEHRPQKYFVMARLNTTLIQPFADASTTVATCKMRTTPLCIDVFYTQAFAHRRNSAQQQLLAMRRSNSTTTDIMFAGK
jgi:hypothetical protein